MSEINRPEINREAGPATESVYALDSNMPVKIAPESDETEEMPSNEERMFILRMVEQGKIKAEEAARLLAALDNGAPPAASAPSRDPFDISHGLRIRVQDLPSGTEQVNLTIPTGLIRFGLRFVPSSAAIDTDAIQDAVDRGSVGKILEVVDQDSGKRVQIFLE